MKPLFAFSVVALLASLSTANAVETTVRKEKLFRFDFNCKFEKHRAAAEPESHSDFEAVARVFALVRQQHESVTTNPLDNAVQADNLRNLLAVARDGNLFYSDGAILNSGKRKVVIAAATGQKLAIVIPRHDHDDLTAEWMKFESFLVVGERTVPGTCEVRAKPIEKGHEYDEENRDNELSPELN